LESVSNEKAARKIYGPDKNPWQRPGSYSSKTSKQLAVKKDGDAENLGVIEW
jgi:hypothetical protein